MTLELPTSLLSLLAWSALVGAHFPPNTAAATTLLSWGEQSALRDHIFSEDEWLAIAVGGYHTLALTQNGSVRAWGENYCGQCYVPFEDGFALIAAGLYHSLALRRDGSIAVWGDNTRRQYRAPTAGWFTAIGAGDWHCLAIQSDGALVAWGWNEYGQCDVPPDGRYVAVCGGHSHSLALTAKGTVVAWGSNAEGQCEAPAGSDFTAIAAGAFHNLALRSDGSLVAWGHNDDGQCDVPKGRGFVAVAAGALHSLALKEDGSVAAWGRNDCGQCDVPADCRLAAIMAGGYQSFGIAADLAKDEPTEEHDPAPASAALTRLAGKALSNVVPVIVSVAERVKAGSVDAAVVVDAAPVEERIETTLETAMSDGDEPAAVDAEIPAGVVVPVEAPIVERRSLVTAVSARASATGPDAEPLATVGPFRSVGAGVVAPDATIACAGDERGALIVSQVPTGLFHVFPGVGPVGRNLVVTGSIAKIPFLAAGCVGFGLAGASLILLLVQGGCHRWREGKKQRQERREDVFWNLLFEADQRPSVPESDGQ